MGLSSNSVGLLSYSPVAHTNLPIFLLHLTCKTWCYDDIQLFRNSKLHFFILIIIASQEQKNLYSLKPSDFLSLVEPKPNRNRPPNLLSCSLAAISSQPFGIRSLSHLLHLHHPLAPNLSPAKTKTLHSENLWTGALLATLFSPVQFDPLLLWFCSPTTSMSQRLLNWWRYSGDSDDSAGIALHVCQSS